VLAILDKTRLNTQEIFLLQRKQRLLIIKTVYNHCRKHILNVTELRKVKKMAIDKGATSTEYLEQALMEKLSKDKSSRK
jgi:hypothetical protein